MNNQRDLGRDGEPRSLPTPSNPFKGISRYDSDEKRMHGWQVHVEWEGEIRYRRFSDGVHGGFLEALEAAVEWRDEQEDDMGKPRTETWIRSSGVVAGERWER